MIYISLHGIEFVQGALFSNTTSSSFSTFEFSLLVIQSHLGSQVEIAITDTPSYSLLWSFEIGAVNIFQISFTKSFM